MLPTFSYQVILEYCGKSLFCNGRRCEIRTRDQRIKSPLAHTAQVAFPLREDREGCENCWTDARILPTRLATVAVATRSALPCYPTHRRC